MIFIVRVSDILGSVEGADAPAVPGGMRGGGVVRV
ncbi:hypothetical protein QFZ82_001184 [Streptomyces sp. V4I23]|nr:hypothetical protein [Streptomyces sp. V4I23]